MKRVAGVDDFDEIEFQAARTGNHVRAAVRMSQLAREAGPGLRAESHLRAGEQWMMADDSQRAADEFTAAIEDGGPTFADPRVHLARALLDAGGCPVKCSSQVALLGQQLGDQIAGARGDLLALGGQPG